MSKNVMICIVSIVLYVMVIISIPIRIKKYGKREIKDDKKSFWIREILIFVFSFILCLLCLKFEFGTAGDIVLCGCGVVGAYIASKEMLDIPEEEE